MHTLTHAYTQTQMHFQSYQGYQENATMHLRIGRLKLHFHANWTVDDKRMVRIWCYICWYVRMYTGYGKGGGLLFHQIKNIFDEVRVEIP